MGFHLTMRCDGPDCSVVAPEDSPDWSDFIRVEPPSGSGEDLLFHSWSCAAFYAGQRAVEEASLASPPEGGGPGA
jgi:hypothetical protein